VYTAKAIINSEQQHVMPYSQIHIPAPDFLSADDFDFIFVSLIKFLISISCICIRARYNDNKAITDIRLHPRCAITRL